MSPSDTRARLATEAGRVMAEQSIDDPFEARRRAATRLGITQRRDLPEGEEIIAFREIATLREHLSLFQAEPQRQRLLELRRAARELMQRFAKLAEVRLVGPVLEGTASAWPLRSRSGKKKSLGPRVMLKPSPLKPDRIHSFTNA